MSPATASPLSADIVRRLFVLLKAAAVYGPGNEGYAARSREVRVLISEVLARISSFRLESRGDRLFFDGAPVPLPPGEAGGRFLCAELRRRGIGGLEFRAEAAEGQLDSFAFVFGRQDPRLAPTLEATRRALLEAGVTAIVPLPGHDEDRGASPQAEDDAASARRAFRAAVETIEQIMTATRAGHEADLDGAKRVVAELADRVTKDAQSLFELSILERFDEYTYAHCVNVCVYSIAIGDRLGLRRGLLKELGFGALFHDIGKAKLPRELIDKPGEFDADEWRLMRRHPALGAGTILGIRGHLDAALARAAEIALEHHLRLDGAGYPVLTPPRRPGLFSRICAVGDAFDAMTSGRVYAKRALTPDEALRRMVQCSGSAFDPLLLRLFIGVVGIYPIGTVLLLDDGETAVVSRNDPAEPLRPRVIVSPAEGGAPSPADLSRRDPRTGDPLRSIRRALKKGEHDVDPRAVLLGQPTGRMVAGA